MEVASFTAGAAEQLALNPLFRFFFEAAADWCDFLIIYKERFSLYQKQSPPVPTLNFAPPRAEPKSPPLRRRILIILPYYHAFLPGFRFLRIGRLRSFLITREFGQTCFGRRYGIRGNGYSCRNFFHNIRLG